MSEGTIVTLIVGLASSAAVALSAVLVFIAKISDRQAEKESRAETQRREDQDRIEERVETLEKQRRESDKKIAKLEDLTRDQRELIEDAEPVMVWISNGAKPPIPSLTWRWHEYFRRRREQGD